MTIATIYALFGDDLCMLAFTYKADNTFYSITTLCLLLFVIEIILASVAKQGYLGGFFFWLDLISTFSLLFDIGWIWNVIYGNSMNTSAASQATQVSRISRGAQVGTKTGRILRIMRLLRLIRIMKLYKHAQQAIYEETDVIAKYEATVSHTQNESRKSLMHSHIQVAPELPTP